MYFIKITNRIFFFVYLTFFLLSEDNKVYSQVPAIDSLKVIYIVNHGWHTGIIINKSFLPDSLWPARVNFSQENMLEIGWGDKDFYMSNDFHFFTALKAALWPSQSVLHVVAFNNGLLSNYFISYEIIRLEVTIYKYRQMCKFIYNSFNLDSAGMAIPLGNGLYGNSQFFLGKDKYYYPNTCNVWTAKALNKAGIAIYPQRYQFAKDLMKYLKKLTK